MSRKKNIANYYKEQEKLRKKKRNEKFYSIAINVLIVVLSIALVATLLYVLFKPDPFDPITEGEKVTVVMEVQDYGKVTMELYADLAPITVENFLDYVKEGFYDGLTFHRVMKNFMIQGGDPNGNGKTDDSLPTIKGEFTKNGFTNNLSFDRGVIGMARTGASNNSASSQFFIIHQASTHLDGHYAAFGKVIDGMDVIDAIAEIEVLENEESGEYSVPVEKIYIEKMYVVE